MPHDSDEALGIALVCRDDSIGIRDEVFNLPAKQAISPLGRTHWRYSRTINRLCGRSGHLD